MHLPTARSTRVQCVMWSVVVCVVLYVCVAVWCAYCACAWGVCAWVCVVVRACVWYCGVCCALLCVRGCVCDDRRTISNGERYRTNPAVHRVSFVCDRISPSFYATTSITGVKVSAIVSNNTLYLFVIYHYDYSFNTYLKQYCIYRYFNHIEQHKQWPHTRRA